MESTKAATTDEKSNDEKMSPAVQRTTASSKPWQILFFVLLSIATSLIYNLYLDLYKKPARLAQFDFFDTANELRERVYGQRVAIEELIDYFTADTEEFKVAVLVGGTGVGKSLASEIIMKNFPNGRYVFVYFPPLPSNESSLCDRLSSTRCNLIVLENLREVDITSAAKMTDLVEQCTDRHRVAVVALINMEETREDLTRHLDLAAATSKVRNAFQGKNLNAKVIGFTTLDDEALDTCIEHAAAEKNTLLSRKHVVEIRNILRTTGSGCKGAYAKVDLFRKDLEPPHDRTSSK
ncbi:uncharacterized protein LOC105699123 isoform X4 [Orussus abietinus]|nr:uncharacterized protein LOC105699123 isoform X4 [Orussus abietinus]